MRWSPSIGWRRIDRCEAEWRGLLSPWHWELLEFTFLDVTIVLGARAVA